MTQITIGDITVIKEKIVGVGPVEPISYGSLTYMWKFGFKIFLEGNTMDVSFKPLSEIEKPDPWKKRVNDIRESFLIDIQQ